MLAYVMGGKLASASSKIEAALEFHKKLVGFTMAAVDAWWGVLAWAKVRCGGRDARVLEG